MTLRDALGDDQARVHKQIDNLMNSEDSLIVIIDRTRMISYSGGFGVSACQLELLTAEIERAVRRVVGKQSQSTRRLKDRGGNESDAHCRS